MIAQNPSEIATSFTSKLEQSPDFQPHQYLTIQAAEKAMTAREVQAIIWLSSDFARKAEAGGNSPIGVMVNGDDTNTARTIEGDVQQMWSNWLVAPALAHRRRWHSDHRPDCGDHGDLARRPRRKR